MRHHPLWAQDCQIVKCKTSTCSFREGPWLRRLLKALEEGIHQGSDRSVECEKTAEKGANDGSWAQKTARSKPAHQPSSSTQTRAEKCSPRPLPEAQHPPRLRQKRRMRENCRKRCKRRPVVPEGCEEQARTPAKQQKMQTTVTARSRRKQPATHLKEPQPKHPGEPRKSSAAQATHGIVRKRAAEPPKRHGSRRKPPAHQKQPDGSFPPTGPAKRCNEHQRQH